MRKFIGIAFFLLAWYIPAYYEIMILLDNPLQLLNPFLQFKIVLLCLSTPLFWIANVLGFLFLLWGSKQQKVDHNI